MKLGDIFLDICVNCLSVLQDDLHVKVAVYLEITDMVDRTKWHLLC